MIRVLFVAHSGEISGGANRSLLAVVAELKQTGRVLPSVLVPEMDSPLQKACEEMAIPVYVGRYHRCCTEFRHNSRDLLRLAKLLAAPLLDCLEAGRLDRCLPEFDAVYTNERMVVVGAMIAKRRGAAHIWHVRSFGAENRVRYLRGYMHRMGRDADRIVLISSTLYRSFANMVPEEKLRLIPNGIDLSQPPKPRTSHAGFHILLAGRIVPAKGQIDAIRALDLLVNAQGRNELKLFLAGEVPQYSGSEYYTLLQHEVEALGLQQHVQFLGEVTDMASLRAGMDLELVCSWCEAFGRVTIEAMFAGLPVIGTDAGGTPDLITDGETGFLYPPRDSAALAERIRFCMEQPEQVQTVAARGRENVCANYSIRNVAAQICQLIEECT